MADPVKQQPEVSYRPPSTVPPEELMKAFQEEGLAPKPPEPPAEAPKQEAPKEAAPKQEEKGEELPALVKIAKERDAFRKEVEQVKPFMEAVKHVPPTQLLAIVKAIQSGDPVALRVAGGFSHADYNAKLIGAEIPQEESSEAKPKEDDTVAALRAKVEALERERQEEKLQSTRGQMMGKLKDTLKDNPKFKTINGLEDYEGVERMLIQYHSEYGTLPGATFEESVTLAAEMYESQLKRQAEKWSKVLTGGSEPASLPTKKAPESAPSTGTVVPRTLTNANTSAPAEARQTVPKTRDERIALFLERGEEALSE